MIVSIYICIHIHMCIYKVSYKLISPFLYTTCTAATVFLLTLGCSDSTHQSSSDNGDTATTLKGQATFPVGNVIYLEDDHRFTAYQSKYAEVQNITETEFDYVGHDEIFRIRETHPTPFSSNYTRLDAFVDDAYSQGFRLHGHNLLFYSDVGFLL